MQIVVVAGFVVVMSMMGTPAVCAAAVPWWAAAPVVVCYVALAYVAARFSASLGLRRLMRGNGDLGRTPAAAAIATQVYLVAGLGALLPAGWASLIDRGLGGVPLAGEAAAVGPFVAALLVYWWAIYPLERALRERNRQSMALTGGPTLPVWTRWQFLRFNVRFNLLFVAVPVGLIILVVDVLDLAVPMLGPTVAGVAGLVAAGGILISAPAIIVRIWRTRPLPAGPLRTKLDRLCRRAGFTCRDILVWDTGGVVVNAAVLGFVRPVRYVLLSDAMLEHFDEEAVAAIFAHEAGHIVGRHIPYMILFLAAGLLLLAGATDALPAAQLVVLFAVAPVWVWLFGMLSRRFERHADVFAASTVMEASEAELTDEGVSLFGSSLLKVGRLNGIDPSRRNYRHGSISYRLESLDRLFRTGRGRAITDRRIRWIKLAIWALSAVGVAVVIWGRST